MNSVRLAICLTGIALCPAAGFAQRAVPANANGTPKAPPGLARLAWPYGIAFLPNGDLLVTQSTPSSSTWPSSEPRRRWSATRPRCA